MSALLHKGWSPVHKLTGTGCASEGQLVRRDAVQVAEDAAQGRTWQGSQHEAWRPCSRSWRAMLMLASPSHTRPGTTLPPRHAQAWHDPTNSCCLSRLLLVLSWSLLQLLICKFHESLRYWGLRILRGHLHSQIDSESVRYWGLRCAAGSRCHVRQTV